MATGAAKVEEALLGDFRTMRASPNRRSGRRRPGLTTRSSKAWCARFREEGEMDPHGGGEELHNAGLS